MIVYEDDVRVGILTGPSANRKTGPMFQLWILARAASPIEAARTGADAAVCGRCPHRRNHGTARDCYVNLAQAPSSIWRKYERGGYPRVTLAEAARAIRGCGIRFGAYGDPAFLPVSVLATLARAASFHTGYTRQFADVDSAYALYLMASVMSPAEARVAQALGYRTFRVAYDSDPFAVRSSGEVVCPASPEAAHRTGRHLTCSDCRICSGSLHPTSKSVVISAHGPFGWSAKYSARRKQTGLTISARPQREKAPHHGT